MISKIKKPVSILLALMMVVSLFTIVPMTVSAAPTESLLITIDSVGHGEEEGDGFISGSRTFNNIATVSFSSEVENDDDNDGWYTSGWSNKILSVAPAAGYTITKVKFYNRRGSAFDETSPFEATLYAMNMYVNGSSYGSGGVTKIEVYGYATPAHTEHTYTANPTFNWSQDANGDWNCNKLTLTCSDCDATQDYEVAGFFGASAVTCTANTDGSFTYSVSKTVDGTKYEDSKTYGANGVVKSATQLKAAAKKGGSWELGSDIAEVTGVSCADGFVLDGNNKKLSAHTSVKTSPMFKSANKTAEYTLKNLTIDGGAGETQYQPAISSATTSTGQTNVINLEGVTITNYDFDQANNGAVLAFGQAEVNLTNCNIDTDSQYDVWGGAASKVNISGGTVGAAYLNGGSAQAAITDGATVSSITAANGSKIATDDPAKISVGEDYKLKDNGDGTYTVVPKDYVAQDVATGTKYESVNDAVAAAGEGGEVKLIADITGNVGIGGVNVPYNTTLDLNGHTITNPSGSGITLYSQFTNPATFTIKDSVGTGGITITKKYPGDGCISDSSGRKVVIEGGTYTSNDKALYISSDEGWTINGGTFNGKIHVISDIAIKDGTFNGEIVQSSKPDYSTPYPWTEIPAEINIYGGTFSNPVPADFCADGYIPKDNSDGTYGVKTGAYVAQVGNDKYETLAEAVTAANGTEVITLLADAPAYVMTGGETLKVNKNGFKFSTPKVEGAYVVNSATADGVTTYTTEEAGVKITSLSGAVTYSKTISSVGSGTYQLLKDITTTSYITTGTLASDTTIDLNGHTFTSSGARSGYETAVLLSRNGTETAHKKFTIKNGKIVYTNANSPLSAVTIGGKYNDVTIENVTIESAVCGIQVTGDNNDLTIKGSTITGTNDFALATNGAKTTNATITVENSTLTSDGSIGVYLPGDADVTFTNTDVTGTTAMYIKGGNVTVNGGTITANGAKAEYSYNGNGAKATGDAIVVESCNYPAGVPALTISGAPTVTSANGVQIGDYTNGEAADAAVTANTNTMTLPEGLKWVETSEAGVYKIAPIEYVAQIGTAKYETLEAAFAAAQDGETVEVLANCAGNGIKVVKNKYPNGLTVDFGGHTYTVNGETVGSSGTETLAFQLNLGNTITFKNGTIYSENAKMLINNYSNLTLDGMTLTLNNTGYNGAYTLSDNNGNVVINNTTINANPTPGSFAFDVCRFSSYPSVNVTVTGESKINGNVEVSATKSDPKNGFSLTLESGTMTGAIVLDQTAKNVLEANPDKLSVTKDAGFNQAAPEGYVWVDTDTEGVQTIAKAVAQIGDKKYATLEDAFAAAQDGETVEVLADCAGNGIIAPEGKFATGLTVDFDGHTYTVDGETVGSTGTETNGFQLLKDNKITFTNGTITSTKAKILVQNYSDLTLDGMTLTLNNASYTSAYTLSDNNGNVTIKDTTINANPAGGFAFDVCRYASYPSVNVTVTGNSTINGSVEVYASGSNAGDGFSLNLNGGTMTGAIVLAPSAKAAMDATPEKASVNKANSFNQDAPEGYQWVASDEGKQTLAKIEDLFVAHSITLDGNIKLNFFINPDYADFKNADSAYVKFSWDGNTTEVDLKNMNPGEDGYKASVELVAAEMANVVHAEVYRNNEKIGQDDYTVREYAEKLYNNPGAYDKKNKPEKLRALAKALLNYGAMAQTVFVGDFTVKPEDFANANLAAADKTAYESVTAKQIGDAIPEEASNMNEIATQLGGKFYTSSVIYLNQNTLRLYFTPKTYPGEMPHADKFDGNQSKYYYYVEKKNIPAAELDQQQYFNVDGVEFHYSALDYAKAVIEKNMDTDYQNLAKALFLYNQAAKAYIG